MAIDADQLQKFVDICKRERCLFAVVGEASKERHLRVEDANFANKPHDNKDEQKRRATPIDLDLSILFGKPPKMLRDVKRIKRKLPGFDTKPIALPGGRATPQQGQIYISNGRQTSFAPSVRIVADMSASVLHTCVAGGPSDNRFSKWYTSGIQGWIDGRYNVLKS